MKLPYDKNRESYIQLQIDMLKATKLMGLALSRFQDPSTGNFLLDKQTSLECQTLYLSFLEIWQKMAMRSK
jgi:hypothetical protein